jgi:hypothetical protein
LSVCLETGQEQAAALPVGADTDNKEVLGAAAENEEELLGEDEEQEAEKALDTAQHSSEQVRNEATNQGSVNTLKYTRSEKSLRDGPNESQAAVVANILDENCDGRENLEAQEDYVCEDAADREVATSKESKFRGGLESNDVRDSNLESDGNAVART